MVDTKQTLENELRSRGIEPQGLPDGEMAASNQPVRSTPSILMRVAIGLFVVGVAAWLLYKIALGRDALPESLGKQRLGSQKSCEFSTIAIAAK